eukprot:1831289-Rhodomonas_salina.2
MCIRDRRNRKQAALSLMDRSNMLWWRLRHYWLARLSSACSAVIHRRPHNHQHARLVAALRLQAKVRSALVRRLLVRKLDLLFQVRLFETLQRIELLKMAILGTFESFQENEVVVRQGDTGDSTRSFFVVERGMCIVVLDVNPATSTTGPVSTSTKPHHLIVGKVERTGLVGEMSALSGEPRGASVIATGPHFATHAVYGSMLAGDTAFGKRTVNMDAILKGTRKPKASAEPAMEALKLPQAAMDPFQNVLGLSESDMIINLVREQWAHVKPKPALPLLLRFRRMAMRVRFIIRLHRAWVFSTLSKVALF